MNRNTLISNIQFPTRVKRALDRAAESGKVFKTAGELMDAKDEDFRGIHFFGTGTIRSMREILAGPANQNNDQNNGNQGSQNNDQGTADRGPDGKVLDGRRNNGGQNRGQRQAASTTGSNDNQAQEMEETQVAASRSSDVVGWARNHASLIGAIIRGEVELIPSRK